MIWLLVIFVIFYLVQQQTINPKNSVEMRMFAKLVFYAGLAGLYFSWIILAQLVYMDGTPPWTFQYLFPVPIILFIALGPQALSWTWDKWKAYEEKKP